MKLLNCKEVVLITEQQLVDWRNSKEIGDDLHCWFEEHDLWHCFDVSEEGIRVHNKMFNDHVESGSAQAGVMTAVATQAASGVLSSISAMFGIEKETLEYIQAYWYENKEDLPKPITFEQFVKLGKFIESDVDNLTNEIENFIYAEDRFEILLGD